MSKAASSAQPDDTRQRSANVDLREHARVAVTLSGKLFVPAETSTNDCVVVDLSSGGAGVRCGEAPPLNTYVVLYVEGFGRYEAVATRYIHGVIGLRFVCGEAKRKRLSDKLTLFAREGLVGVTNLRAHERLPTEGLYFTRSNGEHVKCEALDISLQGISLRTASRPPLNELVRVGQSYGRVVRHHESGIGLKFIRADDIRAIA